MVKILGQDIDSKSWIEAIKNKRKSSKNTDVSNSQSEFKFGSIRGKTFKAINDVLDTEVAQTVATSHANKLWVSKILINRASSKQERDNSVGRNNDIDTVANSGKGINSKESTVILDSRSRHIDYAKANPSYQGQPGDPSYRYKDLLSRNKVYIVNLSAVPYVKLELQNRPNEIQVNPISNWSDVNSMGRNIPFAIYTGGNSSFSIDISWFSDQPNVPHDVLAKCKLLESWSKADGYKSSPPLLKIVWGGSKIFDNHTYILKSATYKLSNFNSVSVTPEYEKGSSKKISNSYRDQFLYPSMATQSLVFQQVVTSNTRHIDIIPEDLLSGVIGIIK